MDEIIDVTDGALANQVQPSGYNAHRITEPPTDVAWEDVRTYVPEDPADLPCVLPQRVVEGIVARLAEIRLAADVVAVPAESRALTEGISVEAGRLQRILQGLAGGALVLALAVAGVVLAPSPAAQAVEGPQPDPAVSATYRVTLGARPVQILVRATADARTPGGYFCGSVWTTRGFLSRACSLTPTFQIPVSIYPSQWPVGRTLAQIVDDASDTAVATIVLDARRPSRFGVGTYTDMGQGVLSVRVPVYLYSPTLGRWVGQSQSPVQIQELTRRGWRVRATLWTNPPGLAAGRVRLGGGVHVIRAVRPDGSSVWGATGQARVVTVTTEPLDIN